MPTILTIAGSDTCSGAGLQADVCVAAALGVRAANVCSCVVSQLPHRVMSIDPLPVEVLERQLTACSMLEIDAVKVGALPSAAHVRVVAEFVHYWFGRLPLVVDPIVAASAGPRFLDAEAQEVFVRELLPLATVVTPNVPEFEALGLAACECAVYLKGGHAEGARCVDTLLLPGGERLEFASERLTCGFHGTGCALSSALACFLAKGEGLPEAAAHAHEYMSDILKASAAREDAAEGLLTHMV